LELLLLGIKGGAGKKYYFVAEANRYVSMDLVYLKTSANNPYHNSKKEKKPFQHTSEHQAHTQTGIHIFFQQSILTNH
jgi:hypothetical protein